MVEEGGGGGGWNEATQAPAVLKHFRRCWSTAINHRDLTWAAGVVGSWGRGALAGPWTIAWEDWPHRAQDCLPGSLHAPGSSAQHHSGLVKKSSVKGCSKPSQGISQGEQTKLYAKFGYLCWIAHGLVHNYVHTLVTHLVPWISHTSKVMLIWAASNVVRVDCAHHPCVT